MFWLGARDVRRRLAGLQSHVKPWPLGGNSERNCRKRIRRQSGKTFLEKRGKNLPAEIVSNFDSKKLQQSWPRPSRPKPIVIIGAGGVVRDAHLPAYRKAKFPVAGIFDINREAAEARAKEFNLPRVFKNLKEAVSVDDVVFDLATPPKIHANVLEKLPRLYGFDSKADGRQFEDG